MIRIAIDGPGGAGKSSVAKAVAAKLQIIYVDTGALYRTIGLFMLNNGINPKDAESVSAALPRFTLDLKFIDGKQVILLDGVDVGDTIRAPEVSMAASAVSAIKEVREYLLNMQRGVAQRHSVIMDGRDIGTVILPNAEIKIFLTASPEARAKRRYEELIAKGKEVTYEQVYSEMVERDRNDSTRDIAPCKPAEDSILLDNSDMSADETVDAVIKIVNDFKKTQKKNGYMRAHSVLAGLIRFFYGVKVSGLENVPDEGGYLLCANHIAVRDVFLIAASAKRQIRFIAKKELFSVPIVSGVIKALGAIKLDRGGADVAAVRKSVNLITEGELVAIFPQGHRYPAVEPASTPRKNGAGLIAHKAHSDVIPVCIKVKKHKYGIFKKVEIIFGKPIPYAQLGLKDGGNDEYRAATDKIFGEIVKLGGFEESPALIVEGDAK
ncbi:MAG: (d)CMP kinase [Clostridia bacterium]|nr:(d)CMP kinase [Clostridia bacterium]